MRRNIRKTLHARQSDTPEAAKLIAQAASFLCATPHIILMGKDGNVWKVLRVLEKAQVDAGWLWVGQIAQLTGLHHETVRRIVNGELREAIEEFDAEPLIGQGLRIRPFRLKEGVTAQSHWRWLRARADPTYSSGWFV